MKQNDNDEYSKENKNFVNMIMIHAFLNIEHNVRNDLMMMMIEKKD